MYQFLIVEDSLDIQELLKKLLEPIANSECASSIKSAMEIFERKKFDLILMDVMLDDGDGFTLTSQLRKTPAGKNIPIIFLTSKNDISDKTTGFQLGAEDYIVKPFDPRELRLRIETRLQKIATSQKSDVFEKGNLRLDIPLQKTFLVHEQSEVAMTPLQFKILFFFRKMFSLIVQQALTV